MSPLWTVDKYPGCWVLSIFCDVLSYAGDCGRITCCTSTRPPPAAVSNVHNMPGAINNVGGLHQAWRVAGDSDQPLAGPCSRDPVCAPWCSLGPCAVFVVFRHCDNFAAFHDVSLHRLLVTLCTSCSEVLWLETVNEHFQHSAPWFCGAAQRLPYTKTFFWELQHLRVLPE